MTRELRPDSIAYPPRGLSRDAAARYIGVSPTKFDQMIADKLMPKPRRVGGGVIWDRVAIDIAFTDLPEDGDDEDFLAKLFSGRHQQNEVQSAVVFSQSTDKSWTAPPDDVLTKREKSALTQLQRYGVGVKVHWRNIKGCGGHTTERLQAKGFIDIHMQQNFPDRIGYYALTEAGHEASLNLSEG